MSLLHDAASRMLLQTDKTERASEGIMFQIGMIILAVAYIFCGFLGTHEGHYVYKWMLPGRFLIFAGHLVLVLFAVMDNSELTYIDYLAWNIVFMIVNLVQMVWICSYDKTVYLDPRLELIWEHMFGPDGYNLEREDFYALVIDRCQIKEYGAQQVLFNEQDCPGSLNILVEGKMVIYKTDDWGRREVILPVFQDDSNKDHVEMIVGEVNPFEFIDSFEWLAHGLADNHAQVTIKCEQPAIVVEWDYVALKEVFKDHPKLRACLMSMVGKDIASKLLAITGRQLVALDEHSNMVRRKDHPLDCWSMAGVKDINLPTHGGGGAAVPLKHLDTKEAREKHMADMQEQIWHPAFDMDEIVARLRIANARMLALVPSPLENLQSSAGVSSNAEHGAKLLNYFRRVVPDLPQKDLHELIKWGKWREYRKQFSIFLRKGEQPYYIGVVLDGQLDVLDEHDNTAELLFKHSINEFQLVGSEDFGAKGRTRSKRTIRVASKGAVIFVWDTRDLTRLMLADPRVDSVVSTLLRGDITLKLRDGQSLSNRVCGDIDAIRRDGEGRALCTAALC